VLTNSEKRHLQEFAKIIKTVLEKLVDSGIPKKIIDTALNAEEFKMREASYLRNTPFGIRLFFRMMLSWQYGGDPFAFLKYAGAFKTLREKINDKWWIS
jgi:Zn-dependent M16 (insulinase) family peptidase